PGEDLAGSDDFGDETPAAPAVLALFLNYQRPLYFSAVAADEITALLAAFPLRVRDPQMQVQSDTPFDVEAFLANYETCAVDAVKAAFPGERRPDILSSQKIISIYLWNRSRLAIRRKHAGDVFVPKITFMHHEDHLKTAITWSDGVPMVVPRVDSVILYRKETAARAKLIGRRAPGLELMSFAAFLDMFSDAFHPFDPIPDGAPASFVLPEAWACAAADWPDLKARVAALPAGAWQPIGAAPKARLFEPVAAHTVLDAQLFD
ncbi:MAG: hypothetical protein ABI459_09475, partial [Deltaproteobacteria bacterium]